MSRTKPRIASVGNVASVSHTQDWPSPRARWQPREECADEAQARAVAARWGAAGRVALLGGRWVAEWRQPGRGGP